MTKTNTFRELYQRAILEEKRPDQNIARIANAVQCHSLLSDHYDCLDMMLKT